MPSRRDLFAMAAGFAATRLYAFSSDFWNKKDPSEWTSQEIDQLTTKSPWAKEVAGTAPGDYSGRQGGGGYPNGGGYPGGGGGSPRVGGSIPGIGGIGGMGGGRRGGGGQRAPIQNFKGIVRWESAQPVLDALKSKVPEAFAHHYVISVSGFPISGRYQRSDEDDPNVDRLKGVTSLQPKDKRDLQPGVVEQQASSSGSVLFGFSKDLITLTAEDKEVTFSTVFGHVNIKAKFILKDMLYHGRLAV